MRIERKMLVIYIQIVEKIKYVMGYSPCLGSVKMLYQSDIAEIYRMARELNKI